MRKSGSTRSGGYSDELRRSALEKQQQESDRKSQERREKAQASRPEKPITPPTSESQGPTEDEATFEEQNESFATAGDENESNLGDFDEEEGAHAPHRNMVDYDMEDGTDAPEIHNRMSTIKVEFDPQDIECWFVHLEIKMQFIGCKSQWAKRNILTGLLDTKVLSEIRELVLLNKTDSGATPYYTMKRRLLKLYGPKPLDSYHRASKLVLLDKPSQLAKQLANTLCKNKAKPLHNCCCETMVMGMWLDQLPKEVRAAVATMSLADGNFQNVLDHADSVYLSVKSTDVYTPIATVAKAPTPEEAKTTGGQVDAFRQTRGANTRGRGRGRFSRGNQRGGRGGRGPKHQDGPPDDCCPQHWRYGRQAFYCMDTAKCPWVNFI